MKAVGSKFVNDVLLSKRCSKHDFKAGHKNAKRSKQKSNFHREIKEL